MLRWADIVFWLAISLWLALAVAGGLAAAAIFPRARDLELSLAGYEAFLAAHREEGRLLIAGYFAERVFLLAQTPRLVLAAVAALALVVQLKCAPASPLGKSRLAALAVAAAALLFGSLWTIDGFRALDQKYRAMARTPALIDEAIALKPELDAAHGLASRTMTVEVVAVLVLVGLSAATARGAQRRA